MIRIKRVYDEANADDGTLDRLADLANDSGVTLLTSAKERERNHAVVLKPLIEERSGKADNR